MKPLKLPIALLGFAIAPIFFMPLAPTMSQESLKSVAPRFAPDPQVYAGTSGGDVPLQSLVSGKANGQCQGLANQKPNHFFTVQKSFGFLSLKVSGDRNFSLLVKGPDGIYCRNGRNAELSGAWAEGRYEIWVGTANGESTAYRLSISETNQ